MSPLCYPCEYGQHACTFLVRFHLFFYILGLLFHPRLLDMK